MKGENGGPTRFLVVDVETRVDALLLRASVRRAAPSAMPRGLQRVSAGALLSYEMNNDGRCHGFALHSADAASVGERGLVRMMQSELAHLHDGGGNLLTFNGRHDLAAIRVAGLRLRDFRSGGALAWWRDGPRHHDLMLELGDEPALWPKLSDLATALGVFSPSLKIVGERGISTERVKCELDVIATAALHFHLDAERRGTSAPMKDSITALVEAMERLVDERPHLAIVAGGRMATELLGE